MCSNGGGEKLCDQASKCPCWNADYSCQTPSSGLTPHRSQHLNPVPWPQFTLQPGLPPVTHQVTGKSTGLWVWAWPSQLVCAPIAYSAGFGKSTELLWSHPGFNFHICAKERSKDGIHRSQQVKLGVTGLGSKESQDVWEFLKWLWPQGTHTKATEKPVSLWGKISSQQLQKQAVG